MTEIRQEATLQGKVADIQLKDAKELLLEEVTVSHRVDDEKRLKFGFLGWR